MENIKFSVIIPAYNEAKAIAQTLENLKQYLNSNFSGNFEIIAVNDGSKDQTKEILSKIDGIKVVNHPYNKGYGASVKSGVAAANMDWILTFDSDGQHRMEDIKKLIDSQPGYDMVVGARQTYKGPLIRQPGKKILHWVAEYLVQKKIPDLNSGLRLIKKDLFKKYSHLLPDTFSWTTTITLTFFKENLNINYTPIEINKRQGGKSQVKPQDAFKLFMLIVRIVTLFSPLRVFIPVSFVLFAAGSLSLIMDLFQGNINDSTILSFTSALIIFFFGLIADQVAAIRREINNHQ